MTFNKYHSPHKKNRVNHNHLILISVFHHNFAELDTVEVTVVEVENHLK